MQNISFSSIKVKNEHGRQILFWTAPLFGSLKIQQEGGRWVIKKQTFFGTQVYVPSINESIETRR